jgi:hypothetical protein
MDLETGLNLWYTGAVTGGLRLVPEVFGVGEPIVQEMLDVYEDVLLSHEVSQPPEGEAWFSRSGINGQCGHEVHQAIHLLADDVPLYLRTIFNGYAAEVEPDKDYMFWEGPARAGAPDKTFEEATFLERFRMMLVMEEGEALWLTRAIPRSWLEQRKRVAVANAPTFFGTLNYEIVSDVANRQITAKIEIPERSAPKVVLLRLRHPEKASIRSVEVDGHPWEDFNVEKELVRLEGLKGSVRVEVNY